MKININGEKMGSYKIIGGNPVSGEVVVVEIRISITFISSNTINR